MTVDTTALCVHIIGYKLDQLIHAIIILIIIIIEYNNNYASHFVILTIISSVLMDEDSMCKLQLLISYIVINKAHQYVIVISHASVRYVYDLNLMALAIQLL